MRAFLLLPLCVALLCSGFSGCAAMQRSWEFTGYPVVTDKARIEVKHAEVSQRICTVTFSVNNTSDQPFRLEVEKMILLLPDDTEVYGNTSFLNRELSKFKNAFARIGIGSETKVPQLAKGATIDIKVSFRQYGRDLRRFPELRIELFGLRIDGRPLEKGYLTIAAPPGAPLGEDV